jgi:hypothetical protein
VSALELAQPLAVALDELNRDFGSLHAEPDGSGGVVVTVGSVEAGERWRPIVVPIEFQLLYNYPFAAIYPYYTTIELQRVDGEPWPPALQRVEWRGRQMVQISLRSTRWQPGIETASSSLAQVRHWLHNPT